MLTSKLYGFLFVRIFLSFSFVFIYILVGVEGVPSGVLLDINLESKPLSSFKRKLIEQIYVE